jgi:hypothetical protein
MQPHKFLILMLILLTTTFISMSQEEKPKTGNKKAQWEVSPQVAEKVKRQNERLREPSFIKLEIVRESNCQDEETRKVSDCYKAHSKIQLKLLMANISSEPINITINDSYYSYNLQLFRNGELVPYRKDVAEVADKPPTSISSIRVKLEPGKSEMVDSIYLGKWYGPLESGHYQLDIKRRFVLDGGWTDVASTTFEVEPK